MSILCHSPPGNRCLTFSALQAKVLSQLVILALLTQYLLAPKIAESMRQRAIMLCRAFTTTESQGIKMRVSSTILSLTEETFASCYSSADYLRFLGEHSCPSTQQQRLVSGRGILKTCSESILEELDAHRGIYLQCNYIDPHYAVFENSFARRRLNGFRNPVHLQKA